MRFLRWLTQDANLLSLEILAALFVFALMGLLAHAHGWL